jgi:hypothetical protein
MLSHALGTRTKRLCCATGVSASKVKKASSGMININHLSKLFLNSIRYAISNNIVEKMMQHPEKNVVMPLSGGLF